MNKKIDVTRMWEAHATDRNTYLHYIAYIMTIKEPTTFIMMMPEEYELAKHHDGKIIPYTQFGQHLLRYNHEVIIVTGRQTELDSNSLENSIVDDRMPELAILDNVKIICWNQYWFMYSIGQLNIEYKKYDNIDRLFISLNHRPHDHRCVLMDHLAKYDLIDQNVVTWLSTINNRYEWKYWEQRQIIKEHFISNTTGEPVTLPHDYRADICDIQLTGETQPEGFDNALLQVVPESSPQHIFITEKTVLAMLNLKPVVIHGAKGSNQALKDLGFELYDEIIDYSFDLEDDIEVRADMLASQLYELSKNPDAYQQLSDLVRPKVLRNFERVINIPFAEDLVPVELQPYMKYLPLYSKQITSTQQILRSNIFASRFIK